MTLKDQLSESINYIRSKTSIKPRVGVILGSGLGSFGASVAVDAEIPFEDIPHFSASTVDGHSGKMLIGYVREVPVAVLQGRVHFYEGHSMAHVVYPTRVLGFLGIETLVVTNAAGGLNPQMRAGDFMVLNNHINLIGTNPLIGANTKELGPRFPDMSEPYDTELSNRLVEILKDKKVRFSVGVYCGVSGPTYETAAEVRYLQIIGGHAVGMSTVPETIAAKHMGLRVVGISCITNLATGLSSGKLSHEEVKETGRRVEDQFKDFLFEFVSQI